MLFLFQALRFQRKNLLIHDEQELKTSGFPFASQLHSIVCTLGNVLWISHLLRFERIRKKSREWKKKGWKREKLGYQIVNFMWNWNIFMAFQVDKSTLSGNRIFLTTYEFHYPASFNPFWCCHWITVGSGLHSSRKRSLLLQSNLPYSGIIFYCAIYNVASTSTSCCAGVLCYRISLYFIAWKMWKLNTCCAWLMDENFLFTL